MFLLCLLAFDRSLLASVAAVPLIPCPGRYLDSFDSLCWCSRVVFGLGAWLRSFLNAGLLKSSTFSFVPLNLDLRGTVVEMMSSTLLRDSEGAGKFLMIQILVVHAV